MNPPGLVGLKASGSWRIWNGPRYGGSVTRRCDLRKSIISASRLSYCARNDFWSGGMLHVGLRLCDQMRHGLQALRGREGAGARRVVVLLQQREDRVRGLVGVDRRVVLLVAEDAVVKLGALDVRAEEQPVDDVVLPP